MFKAVPPADSGKTYKTLDARCRACRVMGGREGPCMPPHYLKREREETGFPCPRREWSRRDGPALYELVMLGARNEASGHLFREVFDAYFGEEPRAERRRALRLIMRAYGDEVVRAALWPQQQ